MRSSLAGPCGPFGVRASRSANPTPSARAHLRGKARLLPRAASTVRSAILRRRDTAFSSRARPLAHHANAASCDRLRGSAFGLGQPDRFATGACRRAVPLRTPLATASRLTSFGGYRSSHASPCPDLPLRRVFLRSSCARRCSIDSLNLTRVEFSALLISAWQLCYDMPQSR